MNIEEKIDLYLEQVMPIQKALAKYAKPAKTWKEAVKQIIENGATNLNGYKIVSTFYILDQNENVITTPIPRWKDVIKFFNKRMEVGD